MFLSFDIDFTPGRIDNIPLKHFGFLSHVVAEADQSLKYSIFNKKLKKAVATFILLSISGIKQSPI